MKEIEIVSKWNLATNSWITPTCLEEKGRSFSFVKYDKIINNEKAGINYIIIEPGDIVENNSKNNISISERKFEIKNTISYFEKHNLNYQIILFFMDADAPIIEDAKLFASKIDDLANEKNTNFIYLIGHYRCGAMNFYVPRFFKSINSYEKTNIFNISTPYMGTKMASPQIIYPEIMQIINNKIKNKELANYIFNKIISMYKKNIDDSHFNYDISLYNILSSYKKETYDSRFIANLFSTYNIDSINRINSFNNLVTKIDKDTFKEALLTMNFNGLGMCLLDYLFFDEASDGMVSVETQRKVEDYINIKSNILKSSHHNIFSNKRVYNDILFAVEDKIEEDNKMLVLHKK